MDILESQELKHVALLPLVLWKNTCVGNQVLKLGPDLL
jgi:hypothetical protein